MTKEEMRPSIGEYLDDVKEEIESPSDDSRLSAIENGMLNLRSKIRGLDIKTETTVEQKEEISHQYDKLSLADATVDLYRNNVQEEKEEAKEQPVTRASRANTKAMIRSLSGSQTSGNVGKTRYDAGPNGSGDTGLPIPGNVTIPPLAIEETEETLEDYQSRVFESFGLEEASPGLMAAGREFYKKQKEEGSMDYKSPRTKAKEKAEKLKDVKEDVVDDLEEVLLELNDTSWQSIDKAMRQLCQENDITPKQLHKDFKTKHGMIPDQWIKEQEVTEECGWFPLDEMTRVNKMGQVYDVSFIFRGGTSRFKFFWPSAQRPSKGEMQAAVEKFYPKARLLSYYPCLENEDNYMVMVPPMTENYEMISHDTWVEMDEESDATYQQICEELGEPLSPPILNEETGEIVMTVEDHDTGEYHEVLFVEGKKGLWDNIHAKRKRGESPAKKGDKDYPKTLNVEGLEKARDNVGADSCWDGYKAKGTKKKGGKTVPNCVKEGDEMKGLTQKGGHKRSTDSGAGLTQKGVDAVNRKTGGNLKTAVTTPPSKLKDGSKAAGRRKSFCARSRGWDGERGKAARRRWNC